MMRWSRSRSAVVAGQGERERRAFPALGGAGIRFHKSHEWLAERKTRGENCGGSATKGRRDGRWNDHAATRWGRRVAGPNLTAAVVAVTESRADVDERGVGTDAPSRSDAIRTGRLRRRQGLPRMLRDPYPEFPASFGNFGASSSAQTCPGSPNDEERPADDFSAGRT